MGMFDFIEKPFHDILNGLEYPIHKVEYLFGKVEKFGEELFDSIIAMLKELRSLFSIQKVEDMFIKPFKTGVVMAISEIDHLIKVLADAGAPKVDGLLEELETPIKDLYAKMKQGLLDLETGIEDVVTRMKEGAIDVITSFHKEVHSALAMLDGFLQDIEDLKDKIKNKVTVLKDDLFEVPQHFTGVAPKTQANTSHSVSPNTNHNVSSFSSITESVNRRTDNEKKALDMAMDFVVILLLVSLLGVFMITKSVPLIIIMGVILICSSLVYLIIGRDTKTQSGGDE